MKIDIGAELDCVIAFEPLDDGLVIKDVIPELACPVEL